MLTYQFPKIWCSYLQDRSGGFIKWNKVCGDSALASCGGREVSNPQYKLVIEAYYIDLYSQGSMTQLHSCAFIMSSKWTICVIQLRNNIQWIHNIQVIQFHLYMVLVCVFLKVLIADSWDNEPGLMWMWMLDIVYVRTARPPGCSGIGFLSRKRKFLQELQEVQEQGQVHKTHLEHY